MFWRLATAQPDRITETMTQLEHRPHYVYLLTFEDGTKYVGMTSNLRSRMTAHRNTRPPHTHMVIAYCPNRPTARLEEWYAHVRLKPEHSTCVDPCII